MPAATPDTRPLSDPIVAIPGVPDIQRPPGTASERGMDDPVQTIVTPVIGRGVVLTLTVDVTLQPVGRVNMIGVVPIARPVTMPDAEPIVPTGTLPLDHTPPTEISPSTIVEPTQTAVGPVIGAGNGFTEITVVLMHPDGSAYETIDDPADKPVTIPDNEPMLNAPTGALHKPPEVPFVSVITAPPAHTDESPVIGAGTGLTVTALVA